MKVNIKYFFSLITIILLTFFISKYCYQVTLVQGNSMLPTYKNGQLALINKYSKDYAHNDVILFYSPKLNETLIKRIIGVPDDFIQIKNGTLYVNHTEAPFQLAPIHYSGLASTEIHLGDDEYFVLGDNYELSKDSRYPEVGIVHESDILGILISR